MESTKGNILIVDDEEPILRWLQTALSKTGYATTLARKGREALALFEEQPFDLVLTDLRMPEMDGHELIRRIHDINEDMGIIILTGYATIESAIEALKAGAYDFLTKPLSNIELLIPTVERAIERYQLVRENKNYVAQLENMVAERTKQFAGMSEIHRHLAVHNCDVKEGLTFIIQIIARVLHLEKCVIYLENSKGRLFPWAGYMGGKIMSDDALLVLPPLPLADTAANIVLINEKGGRIQVERTAGEEPMSTEDIRKII